LRAASWNNNGGQWHRSYGKLLSVGADHALRLLLQVIVCCDHHGNDSTTGVVLALDTCRLIPPYLAETHHVDGLAWKIFGVSALA
jgi:hypothetical protein